MARVKCVMMQRDEALLLEPWLHYYGHLFGFENLTVFDNGSIQPSVIKTLQRFENVGVTVYWDFAGPENFEGKAFHFTNVIKGWDFGGDYDFALPVDCDEFIAVLGPDRIDCSRNAIHRAFDQLIDEKRTLGIEFSMFNVPGQPGLFRPQHYPKGFFARSTIKLLDHGYHYPITEEGGRCETGLTYLHYHHKPFALMLDHCKRKLQGLIDIENPSAASNYTGSGNHLIKYLMMSEQEYLEEFENGLVIRFDGLDRLLRVLGPVDPALFHAEDNTDIVVDNLHVREPGIADAGWNLAPFDETEYYLANPDVALHRIEGLKHYFRHGFAEGRPLRRGDTVGARTTS